MKKIVLDLPKILNNCLNYVHKALITAVQRFIFHLLCYDTFLSEIHYYHHPSVPHVSIIYEQNIVLSHILCSTSFQEDKYVCIHMYIHLYDVKIEGWTKAPQKNESLQLFQGQNTTIIGQRNFL